MSVKNGFDSVFDAANVIRRNASVFDVQLWEKFMPWCIIGKTVTQKNNRVLIHWKLFKYTLLDFVVAVEIFVFY